MDKVQFQMEWAKNEFQPSNEYEILLDELMEEIANDTNSSIYREAITKYEVGLDSSDSKHGYDDDYEAIEVKPQNYRGKSKVNGSGHFNDMTWRRHYKYLKDEMTILKSGFYYGKLIFIVEFPYTVISNKIESRLKKILPNGDEVRKYDRWGTFTFDDWKDDFTIRYVSPNINDYKKGMTKKLFNALVV